MKKIMITLLILFPTITFANVYNCSGAGFIIDLAGDPLEMKVVGNGFNTMALNVHSSVTFDTVISGNTSSPNATVKLTIKDSSFGNPGDTFKAQLQISSSLGIKDYPGLICIRGND